jgi:pyruvate dehydrogenase E2 component (dihydrolipoamide acetyltransferase)
MAELMLMPEVAAGSEAAVLSSWSVQQGATYAAGDVLAVIETDKAIVEYEAEAPGVFVQALVKDGAEIKVGAPIALIAAVGEVVTDVPATLATLGFGGEEVAKQSAKPAVEESAAHPQPTLDSTPSSVGDGRGSRVFSSPLARKLAREAGIEVSTLTGSGPAGRIVRCDVEAAIVAGPSVASSSPRPGVAAPAAGGFVDVPHTRLRRAIAKRLTESKTTAPHFYVRGTARVDALLQLREQINSGGDVRISVNDLLIKAMACAHVLVPGMNVTWSADAIRHYASVDIAVAVATDNGLVTPVVRGVGSLSVSQISAVVRDFAERARAGRLTQNELEGGSTSISNLGMYGTEEFAAIINPPQASILAVGATRQAPVVLDGSVVAANVLTVTLSVDHRPVDGVLAAQWMKVFIDLLEAPARILA